MKSFVDGSIFDFGVDSSDRTLEDTDASWILIENCVDVLCLPERILLEPDLERGVEDGDEWNVLLTGALGDGEDVGLVLGGNELGRPRGMLLEELFDECVWLVEGGKGLKD